MSKQQKFYEQTAKCSDITVTIRMDDYEKTDLEHAFFDMANSRWTFKITNYVSLNGVFVAWVDVSYRAKKANRDDIRRRLVECFGEDAVSVPARCSSITDRIPYTQKTRA